MFLLGAAVSLCYVPGWTGYFIATQWAVLSIVLPFFLWRSGPVTVFHWAGLLFIAYAAALLPYTPIFTDGVYGFWLICIMGLSFWLGSTLDSLRSLYAGLAVGAAVSSGLAVLQFFGFTAIPYGTLSPAGLYVNSVAQGLILSLVVVALVSERMWLWTLPLVPGIALSGSRGAWLALAVGLASTYVRRPWVLCAVGAAGAVYFVGSTLAPSDEQRLFIWNVARVNLTWLGWGTGSFMSWLLPFHGQSFFPEYAHNDALQLAFEYGAFAVLPVGIFAFALTRAEQRERPVIVAFVTAGCYSMPLWISVASFLGCVVAGRIVRSWAVAGGYGYDGRYHVVPRQHRTDRARSGVVPVVAHT